MLGILKLLTERAKLTTDPITILGPAFLEAPLQYFKNISTDIHYNLVVPGSEHFILPHTKV